MYEVDVSSRSTTTKGQCESEKSGKVDMSWVRRMGSQLNCGEASARETCIEPETYPVPNDEGDGASEGLFHLALVVIGVLGAVGLTRGTWSLVGASVWTRSIWMDIG
jgi:hypothetical protein